MAGRTDQYADPDRSRRRSGAAAFVGLWRTNLGVVPLAGTVLFLLGGGWRWRIAGHTLAVGWFDAAARLLIGWLLPAGSVGLAALALGIGFKVTRRVPLVVAHVAATICAIGVLLSITATWGWSLHWAILHAALSCAVAASWSLHRVDALRSDPRAGGAHDTWGKLLGIPLTKIGTPTVDAYSVRAQITPGPGETLSDVQRALERIETAAVGALPGRARLERDPDSHHAQLVLMHTDPLRNWPRWPGPSHLGGSFADGVVCGLYEDGAQERYWQTAGTTGNGDPRPAGHVGSMGMTRSGKSGCAAVRWTDGVFTRRDVLLAYVDCAKPDQSMAGQVMDDLVLYADTPAKIKVLFRTLLALAKDRAVRMGRYGFRDWSPEVYQHPELRIPALVVAIDEADKVIGTQRFTDLATTVLSTGIYLDVLLPRADAQSMPSTARFSFGQWFCFGTGDEYSHTFVLSDATVAAGANPANWGNTKPGYHYLDKAPGVDERRYSMPARSFRAEFAELQAAALAGRAYRAHLPAADIAALGDAWKLCQPGPRRAETAEYGALLDEREDDDMDDYDDDERIPAPKLRDAEPGDTEDYAATDPRRPIGEHHGANDPFDDPNDQRPRPADVDAARDAFDQTLRTMADDGITEFANADVISRYPYRCADSTMSVRFSEVCEGDRILPPGLGIERLGKGRYRLTRDPALVLEGSAT